MLNVTLAQIHDAHKVLAPLLPATPLVRNPWLSEELGCDLYLKLENMQPIGSFKIRGATYRISRLTKAERKRGVICASAGNHAQGVAWGSRVLGVKALIVMPKSAPLVKVRNTQALGAEIVLHGNSYDEAKAHAATLARKTKRVLIPAFEDAEIIAGQGTVGLEILEQLPDVDWIVGSIGGGGLLSGIGIALKALRPQVTLLGCQAAGSASMIQSLKKHHAVKLERSSTFADGIAVREARESMRKILDRVLDRFVTVDDRDTAKAVLTLLEKAKTVVEGSGAIGLAALEPLRKEIKGKKVVLVVSGGNIDVNLLGRIIDRGLIQAGRRVRLNIWVSDRPGSLARVTEIVAAEGANILQAIHDHNEPSSSLDETEISLTLETRGHEQSEQILKALQKEFRRVELAHL